MKNNTGNRIFYKTSKEIAEKIYNYPYCYMGTMSTFYCTCTSWVTSSSMSFAHCNYWLCVEFMQLLSALSQYSKTVAH